ncbi:hypothetical protein ACSSS7_004983 [Eimeria intestinalis]
MKGCEGTATESLTAARRSSSSSSSSRSSSSNTEATPPRPPQKPPLQLRGIGDVRKGGKKSKPKFKQSLRGTSNRGSSNSSPPGGPPGLLLHAACSPCCSCPCRKVGICCFDKSFKEAAMRGKPDKEGACML